jgi:hypothetical protein
VSPDGERAATLSRLRVEYPTFVYEDYEWREGEGGSLGCTFHFRVRELSFRPTCTVSWGGGGELRRVPREAMDNLVFHLGLAELPS